MSNKNWFSVTNKGGETATIHIFDEIGYWGVTAHSFINQIKNIEAGQIDLHINSPGGSVFDGIAIQNSLKHHSANVTVYIDGLAASIASIIALGGDEIHIAENGYVMIHNPSSFAWGEAEDMQKQADLLNKIAEGLANDYAKKMNISTDDALAIMDAETWYSGQEAVDAGFADKLYGGVEMTASFDMQKLCAKAPKEALERFTQKQKNKKEAQMPPEENSPEEVQDQVPSNPANKTTKKEVTQPAPPTANVADQVQAAITAERGRISGINALANKFGFADDAQNFIDEGKTVADFQSHILAKSSDDWKNALAVKNSATQPPVTPNNDDKSGEDAVKAIKARRQQKFN